MPFGELDKTYSLSLILAHWFHYVKTWRHPQNRKYISIVEEDRATDSANMYIKFCEIHVALKLQRLIW